MMPVIAPAVWRTSAPIVTAKTASMARYNPAPMTARRTPGSLMDTGARLCPTTRTNLEGHKNQQESSTDCPTCLGPQRWVRP